MLDETEQRFVGIMTEHTIADHIRRRPQFIDRFGHDAQQEVTPPPDTHTQNE